MSKGSPEPDSVRALLLSLSNGQLILPYSVVQEIILWQEPEAVPDGPDWLLGTIQWRRWQLPVISVERLAGEEFKAPSRRAHIAVCNLLTGDDEMPCVGIVTRGVPQRVRADEETVAPVEEAPPAEWAAVQLLFNGTLVRAPDLPAIAAALPRLQIS